MDYDYLDLLQKRFYSLRKYTPTLLRVLEFNSIKANEHLLQAVEIIRGMNESGKRKVPDESPVDFISNRWKNNYMWMTVQLIVIITFQVKL
ncbi:hypothetical protein J2S11_001824 [Bacillus horti]|uniref:Uncharacterized protein n=1 Tax=Caldalkalibacillus horti TaxID=77523 RepID=A0ABT9VY51_9BACI|nr:hypothetical protein [Bacillus horti]